MFANPFLSSILLRLLTFLQVSKSAYFFVLVSKTLRRRILSLHDQLLSIINNRHALTYAVRRLGTREIDCNIEFQVLFQSHSSHSFVAFNVSNSASGCCAIDSFICLYMWLICELARVLQSSEGLLLSMCHSLTNVHCSGKGWFVCKSELTFAFGWDGVLFPDMTICAFFLPSLKTFTSKLRRLSWRQR